MWRVCYCFRNPIIGSSMYLCTFWHEQPSEKETEDFGADVMWPLMRKRYSDCVPIEITVDDLPTMAYFEYSGLD